MAIRRSLPNPPVAACRLAAALLLAGLAAALPARAQEAELARAQELLDAEKTHAAIELLDRFLERHPKDAQARLLRSTGRFVEGDRDGGRSDLLKALELDPNLRQAWLNLGALQISEQDYAGALASLRRARQLDPAARDNDLNIGVVLLLQGSLQEASGSFESYLAQASNPVEAYYLISSNYALAGYAALAVRHLSRAIELDEQSRLRARTDPNFSQIAEDAHYQALLDADSYLPPPGAYQARQSFDVPYEIHTGKLLGAVIDALQRLDIVFSRRIEVTPGWALVWGDMRIKVSGTERGGGAVEVTAPPDRFTPAEWKDRTDRLFAEIAWELAPKLPDLGDNASSYLLVAVHSMDRSSSANGVYHSLR